jgi:hypothetical protein
MAGGPPGPRRTGRSASATGGEYALCATWLRSRPSLRRVLRRLAPKSLRGESGSSAVQALCEMAMKIVRYRRTGPAAARSFRDADAPLRQAPQNTSSEHGPGAVYHSIPNAGVSLFATVASETSSKEHQHSTGAARFKARSCPSEWRRSGEAVVISGRAADHLAQHIGAKGTQCGASRSFASQSPWFWIKWLCRLRI